MMLKELLIGVQTAETDRLAGPWAASAANCVVFCLFVSFYAFVAVIDGDDVLMFFKV